MAATPLTRFIDSAGFPQEAPASDALSNDQVRLFSEYGGGFIDYTDNAFVAGQTTNLPADTATRITLDLSASPANRRLNRPFERWQPWDNDAKLIRARALYDIIGIRIDVRLVPDKLGGVLRVALATPTVELAGKNMQLTAAPGEQEKITVDFPQIAVRNSFLQNGASFVLFANVPMTLVEFSPEFYPLGYEE